jgi:hypothetical protein
MPVINVTPAKGQPHGLRCVQDPFQFKSNMKPYGPPEFEHDKVDVLVSKYFGHVLEVCPDLGKARHHIPSERRP